MKAAILIVMSLLAGAVAGAWLTHRHTSGIADPAAGAARTPRYWYDPMKPDQHFDHPGPSPFMDMQLVPMYGDDTGAAATRIVSIDPRVVQNLGIRTAPVERRDVPRQLRAVGTVMADENRITVVQTRTPGWVERLHVRATNVAVGRGQLLAEIYSPDLYAAQQEFVLAVKAQDAVLAAGARQRLRLLGMSEPQAEKLALTLAPQQRVSVFSPVGGIVRVVGVREGAQVVAGAPLFELSDLSKVWVVSEVPEDQAASLTPGSPVEVHVAALPGENIVGRLDYVVPDVNPQTRTLQVRTSLDNAGLQLKPGMFAEVTLARGNPRAALMVPSEAVIRTGTRNTVIIAEGQGRFRPVDVGLGIQREGRTEIVAGLAAGQQVVASGQFLIDSEANLRGAFNTLDTTDPDAKAEGPSTMQPDTAGKDRHPENGP